MTTIALMQSVGSIGAFANRAFLPAFLTAAFLRYGSELSFLAETQILQQVKDAPTWFTHEITIGILGVLSFLELILDKSANWRELVREYQPWAQTLLALGTTFGVISTQDEQFIQQAVPAVVTAGLGDFGVPFIVVLGTLTLSGLMWQLERAVAGIDPDDAFNFGRYFSFWRDFSAISLLFFALIFPLISLVLVGLFFLCLSGFYWLSKRAEARSKVTCKHCDKLMFASASFCPHCHRAQDVQEVRALNWLGYTSSRPAGVNHEFSLLAAHRCPRCAEPLASARLPAHCKACEREFLHTPEALEEYLGQIKSRLPLTLSIGFVCSFLPALGFAISYLTNRLALTRPLRAHTPKGRRIAARIGLRLLTVLALFVHYVPILGQLILPFLSWLSYRVYARAFPSSVAKAEALSTEELLALEKQN